MQWGIGVEVLGLQNGEHARKLVGPPEPLGSGLELLDEVRRYVVGVTGVENGIKQLFFGLEVVQQPGRRHARCPRDLAQRGATPAIPRYQALRHGQDPLSPILSLGEERGVSSLIGHEISTSTNLLNAH